MSTAVALVWAYIAEHPEQYASWVAPFTQLRWCASEQRVLAVRVGGAQRAAVGPAPSIRHRDAAPQRHLSGVEDAHDAAPVPVDAFVGARRGEDQ